MSVVAAPGMVATPFVEKTRTLGDKEAHANVQNFHWFAQSAEDGALPLLQCMVGRDVKPGSLVVPAHTGLLGLLIGDGITGPPVPKALEGMCTSRDNVDMLWKASEDAVGPFIV